MPEEREIDRWVTTTVASERSGFAVTTIRKYVREGKVLSVKRGRCYLVNLKSLAHAKKPYHRRCLYCGTAFRAARVNQKFDKDRCRILWHNRKYRRKKARGKRDEEDPQYDRHK